MAEIETGDEYSKMDLLERLESLREEMEELGISSLDELNRRIADMHQKLDRD